jgi:hypothetical protein
MINSIGSHARVFATLAATAPLAEPEADADPATRQGFGDQPAARMSAAPCGLHLLDARCGPDNSLGAAARLELRHLATSAFNKVRSQFKTGDKSTNKVRLPRGQDDLRGLFDVLRCKRANMALNEFRLRRAPLADRWEAKVGNCTEMARMAVDEARKLGLRANTWVSNMKMVRYRMNSRWWNCGATP